MCCSIEAISTLATVVAAIQFCPCRHLIFNYIHFLFLCKYNKNKTSFANNYSGKKNKISITVAAIHFSSYKILMSNEIMFL